MTLDGTLRVALAHLAPTVGDVDGNRRLIEHATRWAAAGADWVISGEFVVSGYQFAETIGTDWVGPHPDPWLRRYARLVATLDVVSFVSHPERDGDTGRLHNSLHAIGRAGRLLGRHRKLHPRPGSEAWSSPGQPTPPIDVDGTLVGLLICADAYTPTPAMFLRARDAMILVSAAAWWPGEGGPHGDWEQRTIDTGIPLIVCNCTGLEPSQTSAPPRASSSTAADDSSASTLTTPLCSSPRASSSQVTSSAATSPHFVL